MLDFEFPGLQRWSDRRINIRGLWSDELRGNVTGSRGGGRVRSTSVISGLSALLRGCAHCNKGGGVKRCISTQRQDTHQYAKYSTEHISINTTTSHLQQSPIRPPCSPPFSSERRNATYLAVPQSSHSSFRHLGRNTTLYQVNRRRWWWKG